MLLDPPLRPGDIVRLKKNHACGNDSWQVLLAGTDVRLKCIGCGRVVLLDRNKFSSKVQTKDQYSKRWQLAFCSLEFPCGAVYNCSAPVERRGGMPPVTPAP